MIIKFKKTGISARKSRRVKVEWLTLGLIVGCYAVWLGTGMLYASVPLLAIIVIPVMAAFQSSLQHEALHGHPTRNARINEALVFLPIALFYPFRRYKNLHLRHHADERLTDPYDDPESYYRALTDWEKLPSWMKKVLRLNNSLLGRVLIGPAIGVTGFMLTDMRLLAQGGKAHRIAWMLHVAGLIPVLSMVHYLFGMPLWLYGLLAYASLSILAIRSFCEHQWSEHPDGRTVIIEKSILGLLFLNNNLHLVHHKRPTAAWYHLPRLYREQPEDWQRMNDGYVFRNYLDVLKAFAIRSKEPVVHPPTTVAATPAEEIPLALTAHA
jgi:fatty acid desaturase